MFLGWIRDISFEQAKRIMDTQEQCVLLDVRTEQEYATGHASGAVNIPVDELTAESAARELENREAPVLVYCRTGRRASRACALLRALGYAEVYNMGGLAGWPYGLE